LQNTFKGSNNIFPLFLDNNYLMARQVLAEVRMLTFQDIQLHNTVILNYK